MNDLVLANEPKRDALDIAADRHIEKCKLIITNAKKMVEEDPVQAARLALGMEVVKAAAKAAKVTEYTVWAAKAKLQLSKEIGEFIRTHIETGRPKAGERVFSLETLGLNRVQSSHWQNLAKMPMYVWEYGLKLKQVPTENSVLREYNRYLALKVIIMASKVKGDKGSILRKAVEDGMTVKSAEIKYLGKKDEDDKDVVQPEDADTSYVATEISEMMDSFVEEAAALETAVSDIIEVLEEYTKIDKAIFKSGIDAVNKMRRSVKKASDAFEKAERKTR